METFTAYDNRLKLFKVKILSNAKGPFGEVIDFWDLKEKNSKFEVPFTTIQFNGKRKVRYLTMSSVPKCQDHVSLTRACWFAKIIRTIRIGRALKTG